MNLYTYEFFLDLHALIQLQVGRNLEDKNNSAFFYPFLSVVKDLFSSHHHGFPHCEVRQQHIVLHDVARHLPEGSKVPRATVHQDRALHARFPVFRQKNHKFML